MHKLESLLDMARWPDLKERVKETEYWLPPGGAKSWFMRRTTTEPWKAYLSDSRVAEVLFIHVPKTAGTSLLRLFGFRVGHVPIGRYYAWNSMRAERAFKFAFTRNPWDRLASGYFFLRASHQRLKDTAETANQFYRQRWIEQHVMSSENFEEFVFRLRQKKFQNKILRYYIFRPQCEWISLPGQKQHSLNFVGRFEHLHLDVDQLLARFGISDTLPEARVTPPYQAEFTQEMIDTVASVYEHDVCRLGYADCAPSASVMPR